MKKILIALALVPAIAFAQTYPSPKFNSITLVSPLTAANGGTGTTTSTGTGSAVLSTSPALTTPTIASPVVTGAFTATGLVTTADLAAAAANTVLANVTGSSASPAAFAMPSCSTSTSALQWTSGTGFTCITTSATTTGTLAQFAATTSAQLAGVLSDETGTGSVVFGTSPTIGSPVISGGTINNASIGVTTPAAGKFTTLATTGALTQPSTGQFYQNLGANVNRANDRLFLGSATINDGQAFSSTTGNQDYISANIPQGPTTSISQAAMLSSFGAIGLITGSRCSDAPSAGTEGCLGHMSVVVNDASGSNQQIGQAAYFEGQQKSGAGYTATVEVDAVNQSGTTVALNPYNLTLVPAASVNMLFGAGGARSGVVNSSVGLGIANNGALFDKGIVFGTTSIASNEAIVFPQNYGMQWWANSTTTTGGIYSTQSTGTGGIQLTDAGISIGYMQGSSAASLFATTVANSVNYINTTPSTTGNAPSVSAAGTDTNVGLSLSGKGTGGVTLQGNSGTTGNFVASGSLTAANGSTNNVGITGASTGNGPTIFAAGGDTNIALNLTGKGTGGVAVQGSTTGSGAAAGYVGQILINTASGVSMTTSTITNLVTETLTPGVWDLQCNVLYAPSATTTVAQLAASVGIASGSLGSIGQLTYLETAFTTGAQQYMTTPVLREVVTANTPAYCTGYAVFGVSTLAGSAYLRATRVN